MKLNLPIGTSDFKEIRLQDSYYIDKSLLIKDVLHEKKKVILLPRPRRFGKTLNMSMLRCFFDRENAAENKKLFEGLQIEQEPEFEEQGLYPVIFISFKDIKTNTFELALDKIRDLIGSEFLKYKFLLQSEALDEIEKDQLNQLIHFKASRSQLESALKRLCKNLFDHFKQKPIVLIDEYDTPIHASYTKRYYEEMISFMSMFLGATLKDNEYLHKCILTGTLRISKESIFTGLNNISIHSLLSAKFKDKFGFTQPEVTKVLEDFGLSFEIDEVRRWYNGYVVGGLDVYNPWSIVNFVQNHEDGFQPYWLNSSGNDLIKEIIKDSPYSVQLEIKDLLDGKPIVKTLKENISFPEMKNTENSIYSFLFFSGYLKARLHEHTEDADYYHLSIPNVEVRRLYKEVILNWFEETFHDKSRMMLNALFEKDTELFGDILSDCVLKALSTYDVDKREPERVYQAFLLGLLVSLGAEYEVTSNRESGYGRYDICIIPLSKTKPCIIMELKQIRKSETAETALNSALLQIEKQQYAASIEQRGFTDILKLAVVFDGKRVWVKS